MYDTIPHLILKILRRKIYPLLFRSHINRPPECEMDLTNSNDIIFELLSLDKPCLIARFGANELSVISNYLHIMKGKQNVLDYIIGYGGEWWWNEHTLKLLQQCAGVWPSTHEIAEKFSVLSIADCREIDILGSWLPDERLLDKELQRAVKIQLFNLEPFWSERPWTRILEGKKVLVVHPFINTIVSQYKKREQLFINKDILPPFDLVPYKAIQSIGGNSEYIDWFDALNKMKSDIDKLDYDIAILGCGAYGLSLAAHIKRNGKKAIHLGGVTQLLFGIKGSRWENPTQEMCRNGYYPDLFNENWCRPEDSERPKSADKVENACYW